jgi:hypothetical protein
MRRVSDGAFENKGTDDGKRKRMYWKKLTSPPILRYVYDARLKGQLGCVQECLAVFVGRRMMGGWHTPAKMRHKLPRHAKLGPTQKFTSATSPQKFRVSGLDILQYYTPFLVAEEPIATVGRFCIPNPKSV